MALSRDEALAAAQKLEDVNIRVGLMRRQIVNTIEIYEGLNPDFDTTELYGRIAELDEIINRNKETIDAVRATTTSTIQPWK